MAHARLFLAAALLTWGLARGSRDPEAGLTRVRRGWTMPGTLWCGAGHSAGNFSDLGVFQGPDVCCREHDHCEAQIPALGYRYGKRNLRLHTISHCDCDSRFRRCLMSLNDAISNLIGASFFNLLEVPCFVLEESEECIEWHWWGGCKEYGPVPLAHLVQQSHYQPPVPTTQQPSLATRPSPHGRRRGKGRKRRPHLEPASASAPALTPAHSQAHWHQPSPAATASGLAPRLGTPFQTDQLKTTTVGILPTEASKVQKEGASLDAGRRSSAIIPGSRDTAQSCSCYRRLDQCPYWIGPHEIKYQLHNMDSRTLFHCNCTRRLARFMRRMKGLNEVEGQVLSDYVSTSCFVLETPPECRNGQQQQPNCIGVGRARLSPARHLTNQLTDKLWGSSLKVKRQEQRPPHRPLRLFSKCRQLARAARHVVPHQT
ncbi:group 3 secretory phospholipase A2 [Anolis carolinensis]|uniref:group 3 secretory phospholipase A2 n=1 Tax=Anolis carolinensis TaxID=28377 RepID=UPI0007DB7295|nr:PREDICTED: group 3 secretory phospholipase A2 [Anolis carolinensis]|eukprot:XP_016852564.1 PREDICTED: group 3 secretory phospholipase A2 [Anolis carolinensis]